MDPRWKWDYSKTFAASLPSFPSTPFVAIHSSSRIMTRRVYGSSAVALNEVSRATFASFFFLPSFAGLIVAPTFAFQGSILGLIHQRNYAQAKAHPRFRPSRRKGDCLFFLLSRYWYESVRIGVDFKRIQGGMENFILFFLRNRKEGKYAKFLIIFDGEGGMLNLWREVNI